LALAIPDEAAGFLNFVLATIPLTGALAAATLSADADKPPLLDEFKTPPTATIAINANGTAYGFKVKRRPFRTRIRAYHSGLFGQTLNLRAKQSIERRLAAEHRILVAG
jgi:hypothetical protein